MLDLRNLVNRLPHSGRLESILVHPERHGEPQAVHSAIAIAGRGLEGDHRTRRTGGKRQVTLIQAEHLPVIASLNGLDDVPPALLRRNLVISGIDLLETKDLFPDKPLVVTLGADVILKITGSCESMEQARGPDGSNTMHGHSGLMAEIVAGGVLKVGDVVMAGTFS